MEWLLWVLLPIALGFLIGYGTNRVAIAMMFRPRRPRRVLGVTFWGVFPRLQPQFADQAGELVAREFFSAEALAGHVETMRDHPRLREAMGGLVEQQLDADLGTPAEVLSGWLGPESAAAIRAWLVDTLAEELRQQVASERGRASLEPLLVPQVEAVLRQPLRAVLADIGAGQPPDPAEPRRQTEPDTLGRVLGVPRLLRWLAASELPQTFAERAVRLAHQTLLQQGRLSDLLAEPSQRQLAEWLAGGAPTLQRTLAEQLVHGDLRKVVADELRSAVRAKLASWTSPVPLLGNLFTPDRLMGMLEGVLDRVPEDLANVVRTPATERALRAMLQTTAAEVLRNEPRQFLAALDESVHPRVVAWLAERLAAGLQAEPVVAEVDDALHESLRESLDQPAGVWLARIWRPEAEPADGAAASEPDPAAPSRSEAEAVQAVAARAVRHLLRGLDNEALADDVRGFAETLVAELWQRPLGCPRDWLPVVGAEPAAVAATVEALAGKLADSLVETVQAHLPTVLAALNVRELVRGNIAAWEPIKLEQAVYEVSKRHLVFVTWFGGFLGALIGLVQVALQALR